MEEAEIYLMKQVQLGSLYTEIRAMQNGDVIYNKSVTESSRNITARVIERDTSGEIYYFLEDSRGFRIRQHGRK
ncbi:hypothetical protein TNCV_1081911 [Trichonephila clavipes]|nr:hypothetical protein TNCV_1081911 [Trichonephila clavipes]